MTYHNSDSAYVILSGFVIRHLVKETMFIPGRCRVIVYLHKAQQPTSTLIYLGCPHLSISFPLWFLLAMWQYVVMVCLYCGHSTSVINSRHQKRHNKVWRRRQCDQCRAVVTTLEAVSYEQALRVQRSKHIEPFSRLKLLFSVHDSLRHRPSATEDSEALTDTIISRLMADQSAALILPLSIVTATTQTLKHFDKAALTHYQAFHPTPS